METRKNTAAFKSMFRSYDIRGRVSEEELNERSVAVIAQAFAQFLRRRGIDKVVLGYDNRDCSPGFRDAAANALVQAGLTVYDIGLSLSPVGYFAQHHLKSPGVMMITASHNPNGWSGMKLGAGYSSTLGAEDIKELYALTQEGASYAGDGQWIAVDVRDAYMDDIVRRVHVDSAHAPRLVIDAGNGGAGLFAYELFQRLGCMVFQLNCDPDDTYPHYFPNPSEIAATKRLREMVMHPYIKAELGFAFDGDGDRLGVMDGAGNSIWSDRVLMLLADALIKKHPGAEIVFDVKCTQALMDTISKAGGKPVMCKTGHSFIKAEMKKHSAALAGERSGHIFFGGEEYYGFDDALFAGAKLVELISNSGKSIEQLLGAYPKYYTSSEIKAHCDDDKKFLVCARLSEALKDEFGSAVSLIDGARVSFEDGFGLVRASSNMPELVLVFEGKDKQAAMRIYNIFRERLARYSEISPKWENDTFEECT